MRPSAWWRLRLRVAIAVAALLAALAAPGPWEQAAARVDFPLYRPAVTLGFAPGPVVVERCGYGIQWVRASYSRGSGDRKAVFGFDESYPRHCGDAGERMTVTTADVNGVVVPVAVYCYSPGPKCTVEDGWRRNSSSTVWLPPTARTRTRSCCCIAPSRPTSRTRRLSPASRSAPVLTRAHAQGAIALAEQARRDYVGSQSRSRLSRSST